jgi:glycosyltransferase involved in cell wall biosynthesis
MPERTGGCTSRALACLGNSGDARTWSGIPYFLSQEARQQGFITHTMDLLDPSYKLHRLLWSAGQALRGRGPRGYQYTRQSLRRMWDLVPLELRHGEIISHFQLFPPPDLASNAHTTYSMYIDATCKQLFDSDCAGVDRRMRDRALALERDVYTHSRFRITMARETARVMVEDYGAEPANVHVVRPGANMDEVRVEAHLRSRGQSWRQRGESFNTAHPARLGFIGVHWKRKGLERLVRAAELLHEGGRPVKVSIIGLCPDHLRASPVVEYHGMVSKQTQMQQFLEVVDSFALGCLPSYAEPLGIGTLEALRLGVPVMGTDTGGIPDCIPPSAGFLVRVDSDARQVATAIDQHLFDAAGYASLCAGAEREAPQTTWQHAVNSLRRIWELAGAKHGRHLVTGRAAEVRASEPCSDSGLSENFRATGA